jgi:hypothetical protein
MDNIMTSRIPVLAVPPVPERNDAHDAGPMTAVYHRHDIDLGRLASAL